MRKWLVEVEVGGGVDDVARVSVRWPVPTRACVAGDGGVRSLGAEAEATPDPSGGVGEGKAGRVNVSEPPIRLVKVSLGWMDVGPGCRAGGWEAGGGGRGELGGGGGERR